MRLSAVALALGTLLTINPFSATAAPSLKHIMVVMFENMSYAEINEQPAFKKLLTYSGKVGNHATQDSAGNGYAFFNNYRNNHTGGEVATRSSQPNYFSLTSGDIHGIIDNNVYDLAVDNLGLELSDAGVSWRVYADDLPDPTPAKGCFSGASYGEDGKSAWDGYQRKHEPFISYTPIANNYALCSHIVNSRHLSKDIQTDLPEVTFYIPNQIHDGHNGSLEERQQNANRFLASMMGIDAHTGDELPDADHALFKQVMAHDGMMVITFDEPSVTGNPDMSVFTVFAGRMVTSGVYPQKAQADACYPDLKEQTLYAEDKNGAYPPKLCNHYNLLKLIEANWSLRGLVDTDTSAGYKYARPLTTITGWMK